MALTKTEIQFLKQMANDPEVPKDERQMYGEQAGVEWLGMEEVEVKETIKTTTKKPTAKKTTTKKKPTKKKKVSAKDIDKLKAEIKKRTGKTEEECEKIVAQYRALRTKSTARKKKEKAQAEKSTKRTKKLKKEGKIIAGTDIKNVSATIDTASKQATKKVDKEIKQIKKQAKSDKQIEKAIDKLVKKALTSSKKFISDMAKELAQKNKDDGRVYLMGLRKQIDDLLKKYELGGEVFDGSGDIVDYGHGGMTQQMDIQASLLNTGNNVASPTWSYADGGKIDKVNPLILYHLGYIDKDPSYTRQTLDSVDYSTQDLYEFSKYIEEQYQLYGTDVEDYGYEEVLRKANKMAKGGKTQGYDDRGDEELGMKDGRSSKYSQSYKDRRDEMKGENKAVGNKPYGSFAKGGKTQGYDDRGDEELGMKDGRSSKYHQNYKDRRDEMKGENRAVGNKPYGSFKKGGRTKNWVNKVVDSPKFRTGAFTKKAEKRGMTPEQFQNEVLANPNDYDLRTRRQAQFMKNAFDE